VNKGIHIIDNTNPESPVNKYFINIPGNLDVAVKGNILYADLFSDLVTIDISNPSHIQVKKVTEKVFPYRQYANGFSPDSTKIIVDWVQKDTTVIEDLSPTIWSQQTGIYTLASQDRAASLVSPTVGIAGSMARFALFGNYLYAVTEQALNVFDITNAEQPAFTNKVNIGFGIETIYPFKNNLFIGSRNGIFAYSVTNPAQPVRSGVFTHATSCDPVIADDNYAFVTLRAGTACGGQINQVDVLNIQNIQNPVLVKSFPLSNPYGLSKDGNTLFICDGTAGLKVYDASNVANLRLLQTITGLNTYDVIATNNLALVVTKDGLYQFDYSTPSKLKFLSKVSYN